MFNNIDIVVIIFLVFIFIYGFYRGIISITIPVIAIISTFIIAPIIYNHASKYFDHSIILKIVSFLISYSVIRIILSKVADSIKKVLKMIFLSWVDRILGAIVMLFIVSLIISLVSYFVLNMTEYGGIIYSSKVLIFIYNIFNTNNYMNNFV
ncbi:CvpA family protein [Brachyspira pilosicoli]|uniref:CvpA family protein n=1 Tax=Brachyspira pilosicoli TaxID=52584 RepID=A0AAJ6GIP3_BRAPL|nr:CvpA family protein [Brachyspira pilosicoli]WIH91400.1 CvpA family protein [Brachyspira pilosicoli]WIH93691.1 CvpA family protein [Brachyspira pilosicoli]WIH95980.1 CvpA family protein [Brachyspira pilosicoli]